ncbi:MAG: hypothetical protein ACI358_05195 [Candidatus Limimorpha sp.]
MMLLSPLTIEAQATATYTDSLNNELLQSNKQDINRLNALENIIDGLFEQVRYNDALPYITDYHKLASELNNAYHVANSNYFLGSYLCVSSNYKDGFERLNKAQNMVTKFSDDDKNRILDIKIRIGLSACYISCNMLVEAYNQLKTGMEKNETLKDGRIQVKMENNLAALYSMMGKYDESTMIYKKMLTMPALFPKGVFYCNYNIANNFINLHQPDSALVYLDKLKNSIIDRESKLLAMKKMGDAYRYKDNLNEARRYYQNVIEEIGSDSLMFIKIYASAAQMYAEVLHLLNDDNDALEWINTSVKMCERSADLLNMVSCLRLKSSVLKALRNYEQAFACLDNMIVLQDSVAKIQNMQEVNQLILKQDIIKIENDYRHRQAIAELEHSKQNMRFITIIVVLALSVVIVSLLLNRKRILLKNKQIKEDLLKKELEARNRELASNVISLMKKNETFSEIIGKIETIKDNAVEDDTKEALAKVAKEIEKTIEGNFWNEFELRFKQVYSDFYDRLIAQYPQLTNNDIRLCAFLKMNLSTKEIASITGQNVRSIDKGRERLRERLGISNNKSISLTSFIQKI